jgi:transcription initiation factor TFIIA small subunit
MTDALDTFISERKIEPQIAIKMLAHFDRVVAEVLNEKVKARMSFKVLQRLRWSFPLGAYLGD